MPANAAKGLIISNVCNFQIPVPELHRRLELSSQTGISIVAMLSFILHMLHKILQYSSKTTWQARGVERFKRI